MCRRIRRPCRFRFTGARAAGTIDVMRGRGKRVAMAAAGMGLVVLFATGFALKDRIREEWWLYKLKYGDEAEKRIAAQMLGELCSVRAAPLLVQQMLGRSRPIPSGRKGQMMYGWFLEDFVFYNAVVRIGEGAVPALLEAVDRADTRTLVFAHTAEMICTGVLGLGDGDLFKLSLQRLRDVQPRAPEIRRAVAEALRKIEAANAAPPR